MFGWFRKAAPPPTHYDPAWQVEIDAYGVRVIDAVGRQRGVRWDDLHAVTLDTTYTSPLDAMDIWWSLHDAQDAVACTFPHLDIGADEAVAALAALDGFDREAMTRTLASQENQYVTLWRRQSARRAPSA